MKELELAAKSSHWKCQKCDKPIIGNSGVVLLYNGDKSLGDVGDYPRHEIPRTPPPSENGMVVLKDALADWEEEILVNRGRVRYSAVHDSCNPYDSEDGLNPYYIPTAEVPTLELWVKQMNHMVDKSWLNKNNMNNLLQFWFNHKGVNSIV